MGSRWAILGSNLAQDGPTGPQMAQLEPKMGPKMANLEPMEGLKKQSYQIYLFF